MRPKSAWVRVWAPISMPWSAIQRSCSTVLGRPATAQWLHRAESVLPSRTMPRTDEVRAGNLFGDQQWQCLIAIFGVAIVESDACCNAIVAAAANAALHFFQRDQFAMLLAASEFAAETGDWNASSVWRDRRRCDDKTAPRSALSLRQRVAIRPVAVGLLHGVVTGQQCLCESSRRFRWLSCGNRLLFRRSFLRKLSGQFRTPLDPLLHVLSGKPGMWRRRADVRRGTTRTVSIGRGSARQRDLYSSSPRKKS